MRRQKPPPRTLEPEAERKVQRFLERAAPIVLECRVLDADGYGSLLQLAEELEVSRAELDTIIGDLKLRGVIEKIEIRAAKPPPLPSQGEANERDVGQIEPSLLDANESFTLAPPTPPPRKRSADQEPAPKKPAPMPPKVELKKGDDAGSSSERPALAKTTMFEPNLPRPPHAAESSPANRSPANPPSPNPPPAESDASADPPLPSPPEDSGADVQDERQAEFSDRVDQIILEQRGFNVDAQIRISATAREMGISEEQVRAVLAPLESPPSDESDEQARRRWREEGQPDPEPPPFRKKPHDTFREFVDRSLEKFADGTVTADLEDGIVNHGTGVLRLAPVFARHIVLEVAQERGLTVETDQRPRADTPTNESQSLEQLFRTRAGPILAQHRGMNAKSRVLLAALADELGLSEGAMERAMAALESAPPSNDARQLERENAFRRSVEKSLAKLPRGILLPNGVTMLMERAKDRFGLDERLAEAVIRELAESAGTSVITREQAFSHIEQVADHLFEDGTHLNNLQRERLFTEASQWGISNEDVADFVGEMERRRYLQRKSEQNFAKLALAAASVAAIFLILFMVWVMIDAASPQPVEPAHLPAKQQKKAPPPPPLPPDRDDSWWNAAFSVVVTETKMEYPLLRRTLNDVAATEPERRGAAYEQLVDHFYQQLESDGPRRLFMELFARAFALEPDDAVAGRLSNALINELSAPADRLEVDPRGFLNDFWGVRVAIACLRLGDPPLERANELTSQIESVVGRNLETTGSREELEQQALAALAERLFRQLTTALETQPEQAEKLHATVAAESQPYLSRQLLDKLNAEFLQAILLESPEKFTRYEALLADASRSPNPLAVVRMVELFEISEHEELRLFLAPLLLSRAGVVIDRETTVGEVADVVRKSLGIDAGPEGFGLQVTSLVRQHLRAERADENDLIALLQETLEFSRLATLACAVAQGEQGKSVLEAWVSQDLPNLERYRDEDDSGERIRSDDSAAAQAVDRAARLLKRPTTAIDLRVSQLRQLGSFVNSVELTATRAADIADYILRSKRTDEFEAMLATLPSLGRWKTLRLEIADRLTTPSLPRAKLRQIVDGLLFDRTTPVELTDNPETWQQALRYTVATESPRSASSDDGVVAALQVVRDEMAKAYRAQHAAISGRDDMSTVATPGELLRGVIELLAERTASADLGARQRRRLEAIHHEFVGIEHVAADPVQEFVMLERTCLNLLAMELPADAIHQHKTSTEIQQRLRDQDAAASSLLVQLRDGQVALTEMWLLLTKGRNAP